MEDYIALRILF